VPLNGRTLVRQAELVNLDYLVYDILQSQPEGDKGDVCN
jgi:hypothetical protein